MSTAPIPTRRPSNQGMSASPPSRASPLPARKPNGASTSTTAVDQRRARREQLRNFYGIKEVDEGGVSAGASGSRSKGAVDRKGGDPLDIDSPAFSASAYYDDLISKSSLGDLMRKASSLSADIGNLEGSRHSLVYNHHHQLFAAGDTISHLNSRTPQLLSIVTNLQQSFSSISQLVDSVALPENDTSAKTKGNGNSDEVDEGRGEGEGEVDRGVERLRLMVRAGEPPEKVRVYWNDHLRPRLEKGDQKALNVNVLDECQALVDELSADS